MDHAALATELAEPQYASYLPDDLEPVLALLNAPSTTLVKPRFITARTVLAELGGPGAVSLDKLEAFIAAAPPAGAEQLHSAMKWALRFLTSEGGLDIGHANSQAMLDGLALVGVLTSGEAAALKALASQPASRAEVLFGVGARVTVADIRAAQGV